MFDLSQINSQPNQYSFGPSQSGGFNDSWMPKNDTMAPARRPTNSGASTNQSDGTLLGTTFSAPTNYVAPGSQGPIQGPIQQQQQPQMSREQYRDSWMSAGPMTWQGMQDWIARNGGRIVSGNGTVITPYGDTLDMGIGARAAQAGQGMITPGWTRVDQSLPSGFPGQGGGVANNPIFGGGMSSPSQNYDQLMPQIAQLLKYLQMNNTGYSGMTGSAMQPRYNFNPNAENPQMDISSFLGPSSSGAVDRPSGQAISRIRDPQMNRWG